MAIKRDCLDSLFHIIGNYIYYIKTLRGMRTRLIGKTLGAASLQADSFIT